MPTITIYVRDEDYQWLLRLPNRSAFAQAAFRAYRRAPLGPSERAERGKRRGPASPPGSAAKRPRNGPQGPNQELTGR